MKKHICIIIAVLLIAALLLGCSKKESTRTAVEKEPEEAAEPAEPVLARHEWTDPPAGTRTPAGYSEVLDNVIITALPYKVFGKETAGGDIDYIAYADGISTTGEIMNSDWHVFGRFGNIVFSDAPSGTPVPEGYNLCDNIISENSYHYGFMVYEKDDNSPPIIYGSVYDIRNGAIIAQDWFDITTDESGDIIYAIAKSNIIDIDDSSDSDGTEPITPENTSVESPQDNADGSGPETFSNKTGADSAEAEN